MTTQSRSRGLRKVLGEERFLWMASRPIRSISMYRCLRAGIGKTSPGETTHRANGWRGVLQRFRPARRADRIGRMGGHANLAEAGNRLWVLFDRGDEVELHAGGGRVPRFLLCSGQPLQEPVARQRFLIVMNTQAQLRQAFEEIEGNVSQGDGAGQK